MAKLSSIELCVEIKKLKSEKNAVILAHYYQEADIQDIADFVGDSLGLSLQAAKTEADVIVFAGVHFMAETAKILNPGKKVILPDLNAGCSLSESCKVDEFVAFRNKYPKHIAITYINCSAEIKANSDIICTSSNALKIVESLPDDTEIIFAPDKNLGNYINRVSGRNMLLWDGACEVHDKFSKDKLITLKLEFPDSKLLAHPESESQILEMADFIGSTAAMLNFVKQNTAHVFIVATEVGILHKMRAAVPQKTLIPAPVYEDNTCACSICPYMKMNTLEKLYWALMNESHEIIIEEKLRLKALRPLDRMFELSV